MHPQRIVSLLPSATEILFAVKASQIVGVTHECDYPPAALSLPSCTSNLLPPNLSASEIDTAVQKALQSDEHSIYKLDVAKLQSLKPTLVVTQKLCAVCAVPEQTVKDATCSLGCRVVSADPHNLDELMESIIRIGDAAGVKENAEALVGELQGRLARVREMETKRKRVLVLEWPDPPYAPGHWVPDMIEVAGGICALGKRGEMSRRVDWEEVKGCGAEVVICAFCGYDLKENEREADLMGGRKEWEEVVGGKEVYCTNASALFSRPGNRLVDGVELLAFVLGGVGFKPRERGWGSVRREEGWVDLSEV